MVYLERSREKVLHKCGVDEDTIEAICIGHYLRWISDLQIVLLKMKGYSTKEIAPMVGLTTGAVYARLDHLRKKLKAFKR